VDFDGRTPLHLAAANGFKEVVEYLHTLEATNVNAIDRWRQNPVGAAKANGHEEIVKILFANGAVTVDRHLGSKLCQAAADGDLHGLIEMKHSGVDFNTGDYDSRTALHLAAAEGHLHIVKYLLSQGVHVLCKDRFGGTALQDAEREDHDHIVEFLKKKGAQNRWNLVKNVTRVGMMAKHSKHHRGHVLV
jgi:ankyrin repeat protein